MSIRDVPGGKVKVKYGFKPPVHRDSPETPALKIGRKAIRAIQDSLE